MVSQDEINALRDKMNDELQRANVLDGKIRQFQADSQKIVANFQQKSAIYRSSGTPSDLEKAADMDHQAAQNRSFTDQEITGLNNQARTHRSNAQQIQRELEQKERQFRDEQAQHAREEAEKKSHAVKDAIKEIGIHTIL